MMKKLTEFDIPLAGLSVGNHQYNFELNELFFKEFGDEEFIKAGVKVKLQLEKSEYVITLNFALQGVITTRCDRCLEEITVPVNNNEVLLVRFDSEIKPEDAVDDIIVLNRKDSHLNVAQHLYDYVSLSLPMRIVHKEGECDPEIEKLLDKEVKGNDSRWDKLKSIVKDNK
jgi:DUF177 domain-containing protein